MTEFMKEGYEVFAKDGGLRVRAGDTKDEDGGYNSRSRMRATEGDSRA